MGKVTVTEAIKIIQDGDIYTHWGEKGAEVEHMAMKALKREEKYRKKYKRFKRKYLEEKERIKNLEGACRQFMWERNVAIEQLKDLGVDFGAKTENRCCDRDICLRNQYNNVECKDCEVNK